MELQLGLGLPTQNPMKVFDLNCHGSMEPKELVTRCCLESKSHMKNKCSFSEAFGEDDDSARTLPLLLWSGQPKEDDDEGKGPKKKTSNITSEESEGESNSVVGWPPIKSWRKKLLHDHHHYQGGWIATNRRAERGRSNSMYVKVRMEGVGIGRKIDLRLYHSYRMLTNSLITMFDRYEKKDKDGVFYTLTYQDKDGDWLLAGDVPWQTFIKSVQRMEILRNAG